MISTDKMNMQNMIYHYWDHADDTYSLWTEIAKILENLFLKRYCEDTN